MRKIDPLVIEYPDIYKCVSETDIDKTYEMPKSFVSYRKPRRLSEEQRDAARKRMKNLKIFKESSSPQGEKRIVNIVLRITRM